MADGMEEKHLNGKQFDSNDHDDQNQQTFVQEEQVRSPIGTQAWVGFGCTLFCLATLCIAFASPFWFQTWPQSFNQFQNIGLWEVCFDNYIHPKDDTMHVYSGCYWVFGSDPNIVKLREWLTPPWMITCQVLTIGILVCLVLTVAIVATTFYHLCPVINHQYHETYAMFASSALMFLDTAITIIVACLFGTQCQDRNWMWRPDLNLLSWGFGFLLVNGIISIPAGAMYFMEAKAVYDELLDREEEYIEKYEEAVMQNAENTMAAIGYDPSMVPPAAMGNSFATQASFGPGMSYYDGAGQPVYPGAGPPELLGVAYAPYGGWGGPAPPYATVPGAYYSAPEKAPDEPLKLLDQPDEQVPEYTPQGLNSFYPTTEQGYRIPPSNY